MSNSSPTHRSPSTPAPQRIAFFGGSFDPPHNGHLAIARAARAALHLDKVLFAPVGLQPLKPDGPTALFEDRVAMTQLAIAGEPSFELSLLDAPNLSVFHPNYTYDTLARLRQTLPATAQLFLLLGADSFRTLPRWHRAPDLPFLAHLIIASRPNEDLSDLASCLPPGITAQALDPSGGTLVPYLLRNPAGADANLYILPNLHYEISATQLRQQQQLQDHSTGDPANLLPSPVRAYIRQHHLYE